MDARFFYPLYCIATATLVVLAGISRRATADFEYISPVTLSKLQKKFDLAEHVNNPDTLRDSRWNCTLYGARSKFQKQIISDFYIFQSNHGQLVNSGHQIFRDYQVANSELIGKNTEFFETLRITKKTHKLISVFHSQQNSEPIAFIECS